MKISNDKDVSKLTFEEAILELESIVHKLEGGEPSLTLEESVELYKRGILLSEHCKQALQKAQREINILVKNQDGELEEVSFIGEKDGNV